MSMKKEGCPAMSPMDMDKRRFLAVAGSAGKFNVISQENIRFF
jgi:hypothetical protein